jgi:hypothetical protein
MPGMDGRNRADGPDAFVDYIEWTEHRYDPGYFLGGNLPPHLRSASLGPHARRRAGVLIGIMAFVMFGGGLMTLAGGFSAVSVPSVALVLIVLFAALKMYRSGSRQLPPSGGRRS